MAVPNSGEILMLSQTSWKTGRAFAANKKETPVEFQELGTEISRLAKALKQLAEILHADTENSLLQEANEDVQHGVQIILNSCKRTVNDLDSLVEHNQVIKKHRTIGGFAIERSWSDLVLAQYKTMEWTTEGGGLHGLGDLLQMHTNSITLLTQALERCVNPINHIDFPIAVPSTNFEASQLKLTSKSHSRLESVVSPMADRIDNLYHSHGSLDQQLEEVHRMVQNLMITVPPIQTPPIPARGPTRSPTIEASTPMGSSPRSMSPVATPPRQRQAKISLPNPPRRSRSPDQLTSTGPTVNIRHPSSPKDTVNTSKPSSPPQKRISEFSYGGSSARYSSSSYASSIASSTGWSSPGTPRDSFISRQHSTSTKKTSPLPRTPEVQEPGERANVDMLSLLPPPALGYSAPYELERTASRTTLTPFPAKQPDIVKLHRSSTTASQKAEFEKVAFRNSAILCDVRGKAAEYSHQINEDDPRDVEMIRACDECRIAVVRKRVHDPETKMVRVVTSIWTFSDDNTIRMELRMDDEQMFIPYSSYFSPTKVSITVPCELKFHDVRHGNRPVKVAKTSWVNYVFDTPQGMRLVPPGRTIVNIATDAVLFQNELMGRTLVATFRTEKTMRIHEGIGRSFSYAEQLCGLENLRVWEDNDTGAIIALIHFSADFRNGYLAFYINSSVNPIKVKDDGNREVKIKGLRVPINRGDKAMRKDSAVTGATKEKGKRKEEAKKIEKEKVISGAKIEFASDMEKMEFMAMVKEMQQEVIELPDLLGVN
ncbi:hypothetical protein GQ44DRAFT_721396 [Phaeosphaeriaceae sp. PMI808]|nr:hypothetical protein GQ44DRAFT_721396 [Phaeosphaeriaceae sp. PMI808]